METKKKKTTEIKIVGWTFIVASIYFFISASGGLIFHAIGTLLPKNDDLLLKGLFFEAPLNNISDYINWLNAPQIIFALMALIGGIYLLRRVAWARTVLEIASWLILIWLVYGGVFFVMTFPSQNIKIPENSFVPFGPIFKMFMTFATIIYIAILAGLFIIMIKMLRSKTVKEALIKR